MRRVSVTHECVMSCIWKRDVTHMNHNSMKQVTRMNASHNVTHEFVWSTYMNTYQCANVCGYKYARQINILIDKDKNVCTIDVAQVTACTYSLLSSTNKDTILGGRRGRTQIERERKSWIREGAAGQEWQESEKRSYRWFERTRRSIEDEREGQGGSGQAIGHWQCLKQKECTKKR